MSRCQGSEQLLVQVLHLRPGPGCTHGAARHRTGPRGCPQSCPVLMAQPTLPGGQCGCSIGPVDPWFWGVGAAGVVGASEHPSHEERPVPPSMGLWTGQGHCPPLCCSHVCHHHCWSGAVPAGAAASAGVGCAVGTPFLGSEGLLGFFGFLSGAGIHR